MKLYLGNKFTGIEVRPDDKYPTMYRVHWPDAPPSEMANLARAKDAAWRWIAREGGETGKSLIWKAPQRRVAPGVRALKPRPPSGT